MSRVGAATSTSNVSRLLHLRCTHLQVSSVDTVRSCGVLTLKVDKLVLQNACDLLAQTPALGVLECGDLQLCPAQSRL
jgi:hypothetical protein